MLDLRQGLQEITSHDERQSNRNDRLRKREKERRRRGGGRREEKRIKEKEAGAAEMKKEGRGERRGPLRGKKE